MKKISVCLFLMSAIVLGGCALEGSSSDQQVTPVSLITVFNANPDGAADVNVLFNSIQSGTSALSYTGNTGYQRITPGVLAVKLNKINGTTVVDTSYFIEDFSAYSIFVVKKRASSDKLIGLFTKDQGTLAISTNQMIRFVNLSPDSPPLTVTVLDSENKVISQNSVFQLAGQYFEFSPVNYTIEIRKTSDQTLVASTSALGLSSKYQTVVLSGYFTPPSGNSNTVTAKIISD